MFCCCVSGYIRKIPQVWICCCAEWCQPATSSWLKRCMKYKDTALQWVLGNLCQAQNLCPHPSCSQQGAAHSQQARKNKAQPFLYEQVYVHQHYGNSRMQPGETFHGMKNYQLTICRSQRWEYIIMEATSVQLGNTCLFQGSNSIGIDLEGAALFCFNTFIFLNRITYHHFCPLLSN